MDQTWVNFYYYVDTIINILGYTPNVLQLHIGSVGDLLVAIDLVNIESIFWHSYYLGISFHRIPLKECNNTDLVKNSLKAKVVEYRNGIIELAVGINKYILIEYIK